MFQGIKELIKSFEFNIPKEERIEVLNEVVNYLQNKINSNEEIRLNFICTHNSRRSHLSQIWAQTMAFHFGIKNIFCYSGGTEVTAMFVKVVGTLQKQGFNILKLSENANPVYAVKFAENQHPIICFSKKYSDDFNPIAKFVAILTCSSADGDCPFVIGAEKRLPVTYDDPKAFDGTDMMDLKYAERSLEIASEMYYIFSQLKSN